MFTWQNLHLTKCIDHLSLYMFVYISNLFIEYYSHATGHTFGGNIFKFLVYVVDCWEMGIEMGNLWWWSWIRIGLEQTDCEPSREKMRTLWPTIYVLLDAHSSFFEKQ